MERILLLSLSLLLLLSLSAFAQQNAPAITDKPDPAAQAKPAAAADTPAAPSEAEQAAELQKALEAKSVEFMPIIKTGRTHLQDATPIRLGQEFLGYAGQIERGIARMQHAQSELSEVALGGNAKRAGSEQD